MEVSSSHIVFQFSSPSSQEEATSWLTLHISHSTERMKHKQKQKQKRSWQVMKQATLATSAEKPKEGEE